MERAARDERRTARVIPDPVFVDLGANAVAGVKIGRNFLDLFHDHRRRQKCVEAFLDPSQFVSARCLEVDNLAFCMNAAVCAAARGRDLHLAVKKSGKGLLKNFLDSRLSGLFLEPEEHRTVIFEDKLNVSHHSAYSV